MKNTFVPLLHPSWEITGERDVSLDLHNPCFPIKSTLEVPHRPTVTVGGRHLSGKADPRPFSQILLFLLLTMRISEVRVGLMLDFRQSSSHIKPLQIDFLLGLTS